MLNIEPLQLRRETLLSLGDAQQRQVQGGGTTTRVNCGDHCSFESASVFGGKIIFCC